MMFRFCKFIFLFVVLLQCGKGLAQTSQIQGKVIDSKTLEPLPFANIFLPNTTIGTTSNANGEFVLKNIPLGSQEIIFSFIGYQSYQSRIIVKINDATRLEIKLIPSENKLQEVQVSGARDKVWERQFRRFEKVFIGESQWAEECKIKNPWVIDFIDNGNVLTAKASQPIVIENAGIGYRIFYHLTDFKFTGNTYSIIGDVRFEEMTPRDAVQALRWMKNREIVYLASDRHLMKSIIDKKMSAEGYRLYAEKVPNKVRSNNFSYELAHNLVIYDTAGIVTKGVANEFRILFKGKIEVHNTNEITKSVFYRDNTYGLSWIETTSGYVRVNKEGAILNPKELIISGDMSTGRVAMMLPLDYVRGKLITIPSFETLSAKRLQEKIYVSTDKPYYYAGETIWLSAFLKYRSSGAMDTLSKVLYVDLLDKNRVIINSSILRIDSGRAIGNFKIAANLKSGDYLLRAYTKWMRNYGVEDFFYKHIPVLDLYDRVVAQDSAKRDSGHLIINFDKQIYRKREKVTFKLNLVDENDSLQRASLSVSITDVAQVSSIKEEPTILKNYSIAEDLPQGMLTKFLYPIERGVRMSGTYFNKRGKPDKSKLTLVKENWEDIYQVHSDDKGSFSISDLVFYDSMKFGVQSDGGRVVLSKEEKPTGLRTVPDYALQIIKSGSAQQISTFEPDQGMVLLKEVEVKSSRLTEGKGYDGSYGKPDALFTGDNLSVTNPNLAAALEMKIPGFRLVNQDAHWYLMWTRGTMIAINVPPEPVLFIDNMEFSTSGETVGDRLYSINTATIDHIEYTAPISSQMGANGGYGAIFVFTKKAIPDKFKAIPTVKLRGFDFPHAFQSPVYDDSMKSKVETDFRSTLYWNPIVRLNYTKVPTEISFYTSDFGGSYRLVVEGVTEKGRPIRTEKIITVEE